MDIAKVIIHSERVNFQNFFLFLVNDEFSGFFIFVFSFFIKKKISNKFKKFFYFSEKGESFLKILFIPVKNSGGSLVGTGCCCFHLQFSFLQFIIINFF